jgi:hypothetical protein
LLHELLLTKVGLTTVSEVIGSRGLTGTYRLARRPPDSVVSFFIHSLAPTTHTISSTMDLLASFHMDDLPEQQTRTLELMARYEDDFDLRLGFDACCSCGDKLDDGLCVPCPSCRRVKYCSEACRHSDANATATAVVSGSGEGEEENALGHTSVICSLLRLCNDDEAVEAGSSHALDAQSRQAAQDRVQSELESYPATLANAIAEGTCYQSVLRKASSKKSLVIHVVGASSDSELWNHPIVQQQDFASAYAEALTELSESRGLDSIIIYFIGPECSDENIQECRTMRRPDKVAGELLIYSFKGLYNTQLLIECIIPTADIVVFFNPGFTVPEYDWRETLASIPKGTPFLSTTNTELEGIADCQYLLDQDMIQTMPPGLADIFGLYSAPDDEDLTEQEPGSSYFGVNPFGGSRVRQSGTMANDLYVKNRWMINGTVDSFEQKAQDNVVAKKQRTAEPNKKIGNPALI